MNRSRFFKRVNAMLVVSMLFSVPACAAGGGNGGGGGRGGMQGPPPEAIEACVDKSEGDTVTFEGRRGESIEATCQMMDDQLVAVPEGHPRQ